MIVKQSCSLSLPKLRVDISMHLEKGSRQECQETRNDRYWSIYPHLRCIARVWLFHKCSFQKRSARLGGGRLDGKGWWRENGARNFLRQITLRELGVQRLSTYAEQIWELHLRSDCDVQRLAWGEDDINCMPWGFWFDDEAWRKVRKGQKRSTDRVLLELFQRLVGPRSPRGDPYLGF